jgi:dynein assembly factor 1
MTFEAVLQTCKDNDGYELPELNEKLYLHFKGFARIENLGDLPWSSRHFSAFA